jgi:hypothetical protein
MAPAWTDHLCHSQLLEAVRQQTDAPRRREEAEGRIGWQSMVRNEGGQGDVDVGLQAGQFRDLLDEARDHVRRLEQRQQGVCARIAKLEAAGIEIQGGTPQKYAALIKSELAKWGKVVKEAGSPSE